MSPIEKGVQAYFLMAMKQLFSALFLVLGSDLIWGYTGKRLLHEKQPNFVPCPTRAKRAPH